MNIYEYDDIRYRFFFQRSFYFSMKIPSDFWYKYEHRIRGFFNNFYQFNTCQN